MHILINNEIKQDTELVYLGHKRHLLMIKQLQ